MGEQHLQYNPSQCISCGDCLIYCPIGCISLDPLTITPNCIGCELCINNCPKDEKVLRMAYNDELGGGWISPFGYRAESKDESQGESKGESSETTPSNPSESESSTGTKDNEQESSQNPNKEPSKEDSSSTGEKDEGNSSQESQGESKGESSFTPADKAKLEALKNAFLSAPPPYKIQSSTKAINAIDSLKRYISTMS